MYENVKNRRKLIKRMKTYKNGRERIKADKNG